MIPNSSSYNIDTQVKGIKVTYITNHYLGSLCGKISHVVNIPRRSSSIHTNQNKYSIFTMKMSEENVMVRVISEGEKSKLKSSIVSVNG